MHQSTILLLALGIKYFIGNGLTTLFLLCPMFFSAESPVGFDNFYITEKCVREILKMQSLRLSPANNPK